MTVASEVAEIEYAGDGATVAFAIPFGFSANADIAVSTRDSSGDATPLSTGFAITGAGTGSGTCTFTTAPASGTTVRIEREPEIVQNTDYTANDAFPAEATESALDERTYVDQYLRTLIKRCIQVPAGDAAIDDSVVLPAVTSRKGKLLYFDGTTGAVDVLDLASVSGISSPLSQGLIGSTLYPRTAAETSAGVTPTNYHIPSHAFDGIVRVERYGNVGGGTNDDLAAFTSAFSVATALNGATVRYGAGTFRISAPIVIPEHCTLEGPSATGYGAIIKPLNSFNLPTRGVVESANSTGSALQEWSPIKNVYIVANRTGGAVCAAAIRFKQVFVNTVIRDFVIEDVDGDGIQLEGPAGGPVLIENFWINNHTGHGIKIFGDGFQYVTIRHGAIERWGDTATSGTKNAVYVTSTTGSEVQRFVTIEDVYTELKGGKNHDCFVLENVFYSHLCRVSAGGGAGGETGTFIKLKKTAGSASYAYPFSGNSRGIVVEQSWAGGASPAIYTNHIDDQVNGIVRTEKYIPRYITPEPIITIGSSGAPAFANSWVDNGGGFQAAGYFIDSDGFVNLLGAIKSGTVGSTAFTLPAGARPASSLRFAVLSNAAIGGVQVASTGAVTPITPSNNTYVSLDGIRFKALV